MAVGKGSMARASKAASKGTKAENPAANIADPESKIEKPAPKKRTSRKKTAETAAAVEKVKVEESVKNMKKPETAKMQKPRVEKKDSKRKTVKIGDELPIYFL